MNRTGKPRRAFTVCLMSESIRCIRKKRPPRTFLPLWRVLQADADALVAAADASHVLK